MKNMSIKSAVVWGIVLWLIGYILGIVLFPLVPTSMIGWVIMPIGALITLWVVATRIKARSFRQYLRLASIWTLIALVFDYFFLVKLLKPTDGYYKPDVYLYYTLTFALPMLVGWWKLRRAHE